VIAGVLSGQRRWGIVCSDVLAGLAQLPDESVHCVVTSPPYWSLRDYGVPGQIGLEPTVDEWVGKMVAVFAEVRRVLRKDGTLWLNLGDSYAGSWGAQSRPNGTDEGSTLRGGSTLRARSIAAHPKGQTRTGSSKRTPGIKAKDLIGLPWAVAFALRVDGWWLRSAITLCKRAPVPESVRDRPTSATEMVFLLTKSPRYYYDRAAVAEPAERGYAGSTFTDGKTGVNGLGRVSALPREEATTRNLRNYWGLGEPMMRLRRGLTPEQRAHVLRRLAGVGEADRV
jgi:hypothetical protein